MIRIGMSKRKIEQFLHERHFDYNQAEIIAELIDENNKLIKEAIDELIRRDIR